MYLNQASVRCQGCTSTQWRRFTNTGGKQTNRMKHVRQPNNLDFEERRWPKSKAALDEGMEAAQAQCVFAPKDLDHRRGRFPALAAGVSFGGVLVTPGSLAPNRPNRKLSLSLSGRVMITAAWLPLEAEAEAPIHGASAGNFVLMSPIHNFLSDDKNAQQAFDA